MRTWLPLVALGLSLWLSPPGLATASDADPLSGGASSTEEPDSLAVTDPTSPVPIGTIDASNAVGGRLAMWLRAIQPGGGGASFSEITALLRSSPDWPSQRLLRRRAEEALSPMTPASDIMAWFSLSKPVTGKGWRAWAEALSASGQTALAAQVAREGWIAGDFEPTDETMFKQTFGNELSASVHGQRLDRLLWEGKTTAAGRMLDSVALSDEDRAIMRARLALRRGDPQVDVVLSGLPGHRRNDPGFVHDLAKWYRQKGMVSRARDVWMAHPSDPVRPKDAWNERAILARQLLGSGDFAGAYAVASGHGLFDGADVADAEWLAGWIALRFAGRPEAAQGHFLTVFDRAPHPTTRARGAFWAGRTAEEMGQPDLATTWYQRAAGFPAAFYGQLAAATLAPDGNLSLPADPQPTADEVTGFRGHELVQAIRLLGGFAEPEQLRPFFEQLSQVSDSPGWKAQSAALGHEIGRPDMAVVVARDANRNGRPLFEAGYPTLSQVAGDASVPELVETPLVHAVIRQESAFNKRAVSSAGARGMMQLMPETARGVAASTSLPYSPADLTESPGYNITLGQTYLSEMLSRFGGNYVLALAAYNAGPSRVNQWLRAHGDPRLGLHEAIDWIERIPFSETRNYVQRTLENLQVYRGKLNGAAAPNVLAQDMVR